MFLGKVGGVKQAHPAKKGLMDMLNPLSDSQPFLNSLFNLSI